MTITNDTELSEKLKKLIDEVKAEGYGEVVFKTTIQNGKIVTVVLYKTVSIKIS